MFAYIVLLILQTLGRCIYVYIHTPLTVVINEYYTGSLQPIHCKLFSLSVSPLVFGRLPCWPCELYASWREMNDIGGLLLLTSSKGTFIWMIWLLLPVLLTRQQRQRWN